VLPRPVRVGARFALADGGPLFEGSGELGGIDPAELQSAYKIPTGVESPQTIAVIEAYGYPDAESDLAAYRSKYGLPPCTTASGCFAKVNGKGKEESYPPEESSWDEEAALDEDMVSAACPECHIVMVEAKNQDPSQLGDAVNTAVNLGATEISNSYGFPEAFEELCGAAGCSQYDKDYEHPGVLIMASAGDSGYENTYLPGRFFPLSTLFPASSPDVVAVGGTALYKDAKVTRGWREEVWNETSEGYGTGSGCSKFEPKPAWQTDAGCAHRTDDDVAAVAAGKTPVSIRFDGGWALVGGTSVASPLLATIMAHASAYVRSLGARAFYEQPSSLFDVTEGFNGYKTSECSPNLYLCNAEIGYDGPSGLGTPDGVPVIAGSTRPTVAAVAPDEGPTKGGTKVKISGTNFTNVSAVEFGGVEAKKYKVSSSTSIEATAPANAAGGAVNVVVTTTAGESATSKGDTFTYAGAPTVTKVKPDEGPTSGGTEVTISGTNFTGATKVAFGKAKDKKFTVVSATSITTDASASKAEGTVDVVVTTKAGTSATNAGDEFTYVG
jgi:subtilase family serine protease